MSKKLASGASNLVLDVKVGSGAFMKDISEAKKLAKTMVEIGTKANINVIAVLSNMDQPLGKNIGNALEVQEVIEVLSGSGPEDLKQLAITLASHMVSISQKIAYKTALKKVIAV